MERGRDCEGKEHEREASPREEDEFYCDTCKALGLANSGKQIARVIARAIYFPAPRKGNNGNGGS